LVEDMTWIAYDLAEQLIVINFTDFCKSFYSCGTQFGTFTVYCTLIDDAVQ